MFASGDLSAEYDGDHLIAEVAIVSARVRGKKHVGPAGRDQRMVKVPVALLPKLLILALPRKHALFHDAELVVRRNHSTFPIEIARREGLLERVVFKQQAQLGDLPEIFRRHWRNLEAALSLGHDEAFGAHPVQKLAQGRDGHAIALTNAFKPQLLTRR